MGGGMWSFRNLGPSEMRCARHEHEFHGVKIEELRNSSDYGKGKGELGIKTNLGI